MPGQTEPGKALCLRRQSKQIGGQTTVRESGNPPSVDFKTSGTWYELFFEVS